MWYYQEDNLLKTIVISFGCLCKLFGLKEVVQTFQKLMGLVLHRLDFVFFYIIQRLRFGG